MDLGLGKMDVCEVVEGVSMGDAERLLSLFDKLPPEDRGEVIHFAAFLARKADPVAWSMDHAPADDEPLSDDEIAEIEAAKAEYRAKGGRTLDQVAADLER